MTDWDYFAPTKTSWAWWKLETVVGDAIVQKFSDGVFNVKIKDLAEYCDDLGDFPSEDYAKQVAISHLINLLSYKIEEGKRAEHEKEMLGKLINKE